MLKKKDFGVAVIPVVVILMLLGVAAGGLAFGTGKGVTNTSLNTTYEAYEVLTGEEIENPYHAPEGGYGDGEITPGDDEDITLWVPYAIYSETDSSLTFYNNSKYITLKVGDKYNKKKVSAIYTGFDTDIYSTTDLPAWVQEHQLDIKSVKVADTGINPDSISYWFYGMKNCTSFDLGKLDTSGITEMKYVFYQVGYTEHENFSIEMSTWDTSAVTDFTHFMNSAGAGATNTWTCGNINTHQVTANGRTYNAWSTESVYTFDHFMYGAGSSAVTAFELDISNWDMTGVNSMAYMFDSAGYSARRWTIGNTNPHTVTVGTQTYKAWDLSTVESTICALCGAGYSASEFFELYVSDWDTSAMKNTYYLFYGVGANSPTFTELDLSSWDFSKVVNIRFMFYECGANYLQTIKLPKNIKSNVKMPYVTTMTWYDATDGYKAYPEAKIPVGNAESHTLVRTPPPQ